MNDKIKELTLKAGFCEVSGCGITETVENDDHYLFHNESGSIYKCFKESQGMSAYTAGIFEDWAKDLPKGTSMIIDEY